MASTLKFGMILPPISGSLMSAPSMANVASTPRWPLIANCWVKFVAPFVSVIVPAARSNKVLKSRPFRGKELTAWPESASPPVALLPCCAATVISPRLDNVITTGGASEVRVIAWA